MSTSASKRCLSKLISMSICRSTGIVRSKATCSGSSRSASVGVPTWPLALTLTRPIGPTPIGPTSMGRPAMPLTASPMRSLRHRGLEEALTELGVADEPAGSPG